MHRARGHAAALSPLLGLGVLAAATVLCTSQAHLPTGSAALFAAPEALLPTHGAAPGVDLSPAEDESARLTRSLKDQVTSAYGVTGSRALAPYRSSTLFPAAVLAPPVGIAFALGPRAPPPVTDFDLWRLAWQA